MSVSAYLLETTYEKKQDNLTKRSGCTIIFTLLIFFSEVIPT
jgi:hypothetical protein